MSNKDLGNKTEAYIVKKLREHNWWVHLFSYNTSGQPCDIVALKENKSMLLDAKNCDNGLFYLTRIEPNQQNCFEYATSLGVVNCGFVIKSEDELYYLPYIKSKELNKEGKARVSVNDLEKFENII